MTAQLSIRKVAALAIIVASLAIIGGFVVDVEAFAGNLLAEVAGILLGAVLAVLIVDRAVEVDRSRRWRLVSDQTLETLRFVVIRAGMDIYLSLPAPRPPQADPYTLGELGQRNQLAEALNGLAAVVADAPEMAVQEELVDKLKNHLQVVRGGVLPQLLAVGQHQLIARLSAVEACFQSLEHAVWVERRFGGPREFGQELAKLVRALAGISSEIDRPDKD